MRKKFFNSYIFSGGVGFVFFLLDVGRCLEGNEGEKRENFTILYEIFNVWVS